MESFLINVGEPRSYVVEIGENILFNPELSRFDPISADKYFIITDDIVKNIWASDFQKFLQRHESLEVRLISIPPGESSKTPETISLLARKLAQNKCSKDSVIIAFGGGVIGDIAGFLASQYFQGIGFIQVPTTLVAQVDSSIGGKTGVNLPEGKNLLGTFYQPLVVISDVATLSTLQEREIKNGLAELIKYGSIADEGFFTFLEKTYTQRDSATYKEWVQRAVKIKAEFVERDELDKGIRMLLNYGHTIGHAIETAAHYRISHGEAIALGMAREGTIAYNLDLLSKEDLNRQNSLIAAVGLPTAYNMIPESCRGKIHELIEIMERDKKSYRGKIRMVLPKSIGIAYKEKEEYTIEVDTSLISTCLREDTHRNI